MPRLRNFTPFDFSDIRLIPNFSTVDSRSQCDTSISFGSRTFDLPVVPANMECVINIPLAEKLASNNFFYIYHRFHNDTVEFVRYMKSKGLFTSISVGVNKDSYDILDLLSKELLIPDYITIDIAHGHSIKVEKMIKYIRTLFSTNTFIIAGNVASTDAVVDLESWGANCIKVGVGPGMACSTYMATGFGSRGAQASVVEACSNARKNSNTHIIADGGILNHGDIAKALVLGASMVMLGGMLSGFTDSPGNLVTGLDGKDYKEFWGSASQFQSGKTNRIEGVKKLIPAKHHGILHEFHLMKESLQSAISYAGGNTLLSLKYVYYF